MTTRISRRTAIVMVLVSPFIGSIGLGYEDAGTAGRVLIIAVLVAWTLAFVAVVALSIRRNEPIADDDAEPSVADRLALDIDDPEQRERLARAERDTDRMRLDEPGTPSIPPYYLP